MPFTGQVALPLDDVLAQWGEVEPGAHFVIAGTEYECVALNRQASLVHAVPVT